MSELEFYEEVRTAFRFTDDSEDRVRGVEVQVLGFPGNLTLSMGTSFASELSANITRKQASALARFLTAWVAREED